jgi:AcrR family transcriptional regulator
MADDGPGSTRERILAAAEALFAESGFEATPTSRIAQRAEVPKGLVHYYFRRKQDLLAALVERLPGTEVDPSAIVVPGDLAGTLSMLVDALDAMLDRSAVLSHLLWREADTHPSVRDALHARFDSLVAAVRETITAARPDLRDGVDSAAVLLASTISYRHSMARHTAGGCPGMGRELAFVANALGG